MKKSIFAFTLVVCLVLAILPAYALNTDSKDTTVDTEKVVINTAVDWLNANYSEYYDLQDVHANIVRTREAENATNYTVAMSCKTKLKAASVEELPFVQGMYEELRSRENTSEVAKEAVDNYVDGIDYSDEYTNLSIDLVISVSNASKGTDLTVYFQDGMDTTLHPIEVLDLDSNQMYQDGKASVDEITENY